MPSRRLPLLNSGSFQKRPSDKLDAVLCGYLSRCLHDLYPQVTHSPEHGRGDPNKAEVTGCL